MNKVLEVNVKCHGHDSERLTDSKEVSIKINFYFSCANNCYTVTCTGYEQRTPTKFHIE